MRIFKKILRITGWIAGSFLMLLIIIALLVQLPTVQNFIIHKATTFVSNKTHTKIEIKKIGLAFPKSIFINGLFLEDLSRDTLLYAGEVKVNLDMIGLIKSNIHLHSVLLRDVTGKLSRTQDDSLFNFNFLLTAFSSNAAKKDTAVKNQHVKNGDLKIDNVTLNNIRLVYEDKFSGLLSSLFLEQLELNMDEMDLQKQIYRVDNLLVIGLNGNLLISKKSNDDQTKNSNILPQLTAQKIEIKDSKFNYRDIPSSNSVITSINDFALTNADLDLNKQKFFLDNLLLAQSEFQLNTIEQSESSTDTFNAKPQTNNNWRVVIKEINFTNNQLAFNVNNKPVSKNSFDASHINYKNISLNAENIFYSSEKTEANIKHFSAIDSSGFEIKKLQVDFLMDKNSVTANNVKIQTNNSNINAKAKLQFASVESLKDSLQNLFVYADLGKVEIGSKDIVYFSPQLKTQPLFKGENITVFLSGKISGQIKNLEGKNISVKAGNKTTIKTDFVITGLPDVKNASFRFPDFKMTTGKNDLIAFLGKDLIPQNINLPEDINLHAKFKGEIKSFESSFEVTSDFGNIIADAVIDGQENFKSKIQLKNFDAGKLLNNKEMFGPVTLNATVDGKGLEKNTTTANIVANGDEIYLNKYSYHNLSINGKVSGQQFDGSINLNDTNIVFDFKGIASIAPGKEFYKFSLDLKGADLKNLHFSKEDLRVGMTVNVDLKGKDMNTINGNAGITHIVLAHNGKKYILDSLLMASINEKGKSELNISSALIGIKYNGTFAPGKLVSKIKKHISNYFPINLEDTSVTTSGQNFSFEIQLHNHPVLSELLLPQLKEFEPGVISGNFDSEKQILNLNATITKLNYGGVELNELVFDVSSDQNSLNYQLSCNNIFNSQIRLHDFLLQGKMADKVAYINLSSIDEKQNKMLALQSKIFKENENYKLTFIPGNFFLANQQWQVPGDNYVAFGKEGLLIHNLSLKKSGEEISVASVNEKFNDDLKVIIKNFQLDDISRIVQKDTSLLQGTVNGEVLLKKINNSYGMIADASINDLGIRGAKVGNLTTKADNSTAGKFNVSLKLTGEENDISINGFYMPDEVANALNIKADISSLSMKTIEALSMGQISNSAGKTSGSFSIEGNSKEPLINGSLTFNDAYFNPAALNNRLHLKNETIKIKPDGVYFNNFIIEDESTKTATINGFIKMNQFSDFNFGLNVKSNDFTVFNTTEKDNKVYYGKMIIDSRIDVKGSPEFPIVTSKVTIKDGSNFTFAVPEKKLSTERGENVVLFVDSLKFHPIITRNEEIEKQKSSLKGFDISSSIEVDEKATLRMLLDPTTNDSLVVKGNAALSFSLDPSGKISLTGTYNLTEGSYLVSLKSVVKKRFEIETGSTIIWNGDPMDADVNINAIYNIRTSPIDLVADQIAGLSEADKNSYRERLPFLVYLKLRGPILQPEISFEIQLPPEEKGALGGAINAKLNLLNEDPSALNKQVFALLVLGRFIQENPLESSGGGGGIGSIARSSVSSFLSAQLNQLSSKVLPGVELSFDVQSYDDYTSGQAEGRTEVGIGLQKHLFNDRLSVEVGGKVDVEGQKAQQNTTSDIAEDATVEYKVTEDGRYRLKGFRLNEYEGAIDGEVVETGVGVLYTRSFNRWKEFFKPPKKKMNKEKEVTETDEKSEVK